MKKAILLRFTAILLLVLAAGGIFTCYCTGRNLLDTNRASLFNTIHVVDYFLDYGGDLSTQLTRLHEAALDGNSRVTVIGADGTVCADNEVDRVETLENHLEREEVREALETGTGYAARYSASMGRSMLYAAARSARGDYIIRLAVPYTGILDYMRRSFPALLAGLLGIFAISLVMAFRFADTVITPLRGICTEMEKVKRNESPLSFPKYRYRELNVIAETTLRMAEEIGEHMESLEREKGIRQEFFSNASHELKTPITSIRGYAELLNQGLVSDEAVQKDFLARILRETEHMTGLIDDILMISRLETKETEETFTTVCMQSLLVEVMESAEPIAADYGVTLHADCSPVWVRAGARQLRELLMNLISNGIKYNHSGGNVWVEIASCSGGLAIRVRDDGCGIGRTEQERIFERFYRVDKGRSRKMGGTGLGLAIVRHIVEFYGGDITLESVPGEGSCFTVRLPLVHDTGDRPADISAPGAG